MDVDSIPAGSDFVAYLHEQVDRCQVLIVLIGDHWVTPRLRDRNDFVRIEIERAVSQGKAILPVLLDDAPMPKDTDVPYALDGLLRRQAIRIRRDSYGADLKTLISQIQSTELQEPIKAAWLDRLPWRKKHKDYSLTSAFSQKVSDEIFRELLTSTNPHGLGRNESRELTVMFADASGFTQVAESMTPDDLIPYLQDIMTPISDALIRRRGTLDKFIGDSVLAFWNAPLDDPTPEANACAAILDMREAVTRINKDFLQRNQPKVNLGVGLVTGPCTVGMMGSRWHPEYSIVGDTVNLASRLSSLTRQYGVWNLINEATALTVQHHFAVLAVDHLTLKGKAAPAKVFTLVGDESIGRDAEFQAFVSQYDHALQAYSSKDWDIAREAFNTLNPELVAALGIDSLITLYLERIASSERSPPSA